MKSREIVITGIGLAAITILVLMTLPAANYFYEPTRLDYDEIKIDADKLKELRSSTGLETIFFHSVYDKDIFWEEDDIHLAPTAWKNAAGTGNYEWVNIKNAEIFNADNKHTFDDVIVGRSVYAINQEQIRYLTEEVSNVYYFKLIPEKRDGSFFVSYRIAAFDRDENEIDIDDNHQALNPSPPAKFLSR